MVTFVTEKHFSLILIGFRQKASTTPLESPARHFTHQAD